MKVYILLEWSSRSDARVIMSIWATRGGAEREAKRLAYRACDGYHIEEHDLKDMPVVDSKPVTRVPGKPDRRRPAAGNVDGLYRSLSPRQRYVIATDPHAESCALSGRTAEEVDAVTEKCKLWLAAKPNLSTVKTKEEL